jgi:predicted GTPase
MTRSPVDQAIEKLSEVFLLLETSGISNKAKIREILEAAWHHAKGSTTERDHLFPLLPSLHDPKDDRERDQILERVQALLDLIMESLVACHATEHEVVEWTRSKYLRAFSSMIEKRKKDQP